MPHHLGLDLKRSCLIKLQIWAPFCSLGVLEIVIIISITLEQASLSCLALLKFYLTIPKPQKYKTLFGYNWIDKLSTILVKFGPWLRSWPETNNFASNFPLFVWVLVTTFFWMYSRLVNYSYRKLLNTYKIDSFEIIGTIQKTQMCSLHIKDSKYFHPVHTFWLKTQVYEFKWHNSPVPE